VAEILEWFSVASLGVACVKEFTLTNVRYNYCVSGHFPSSCFFFIENSQRFGDWFLLRLQAEPTQSRPVNRAGPYLRTWAPSLSLMLRPTVSRLVCLGIKQSSGAYDQICITVRQLRFFYLGRSLWREDVSVFYNCCWPSPAQSSSGPSPLGLATISYCLRLETSLVVASYDPWATVEVFDPASTRDTSARTQDRIYI
jgi:hypothetical protein